MLALRAGDVLEFPDTELDKVYTLIMIVRTVKRYSTARSGLKYAARIARSMSVRANPMLSMFAIAADRSSPMAKAFGSSRRLDEGEDGVCGAGEGVAGASEASVIVDGTGAGAAGVRFSWITGTGVEGVAVATLLLDAPG